MNSSIQPLPYDDPSNAMMKSKTRESLTGNHAYYRSKLFTAYSDINPIVCAAAPLLSLAIRIHDLTVAPDLAQLHQDICHEIKAYEHQAQLQKYHSHIILAGRYALCSLLDETINSATWCPQGAWAKHNLLITFHREPWGGERFFTLLERSLEDPHIHIDIIELMYICLSIGYQGKFLKSPNGTEQHLNIRDQVYQSIRHHRGEFSKNLLAQAQTTTTQPKKSIPHRWKVFIALLVGVSLTLTTYSLLNHQLNKILQPILIHIQP